MNYEPKKDDIFILKEDVENGRTEDIFMLQKGTSLKFVTKIKKDDKICLKHMDKIDLKSGKEYYVLDDGKTGWCYIEPKNLELKGREFYANQ